MKLKFNDFTRAYVKLNKKGRKSIPIVKPKRSSLQREICTYIWF